MHRLLALTTTGTTLLLLLVAAEVAADGGSNDARKLYTSRFDNIDLDRILTSRRLVANYVDCLLGRKRCPPEGAELKRVLPDALATRCAKCSEQQREAALRAVRLLRQRFPDLWAPLQQKWDPTGEHTRRLEQATARRAAAAASYSAAALGTTSTTTTSTPTSVSADSLASPVPLVSTASSTPDSTASAASDSVSVGTSPATPLVAPPRG